MTDAVIIKTRKFKRNPLLARKQVCGVTIFVSGGWMCIRDPYDTSMAMCFRMEL